MSEGEPIRVIDLALNRVLGLQAAAEGSGAILEMPEAPLLLNHVGTVHAAALFALAEASSAAFLLEQLGELAGGTFAVLRNSEQKFRRPARGTLRGSASFAEADAAALAAELGSRKRAIAAILVEVLNVEGEVVMSGRFGWFLQRQER